MPTPPLDRRRPENAGRIAGRLDSWKEVAAYLGKAERTVKRWELERGLPTHRIPGRGRSSIYAFTAELDEWLESHSREAADEIESEPDTALEAEAEQNSAAATTSTHTLPPPSPAQSSTRATLPRLWLGALALLLLAVAAPALWHFRFAKKAATSDSERRLAHDLYLKGRYEWNQRTPDSLNRALDYFTQAVVHDPGNAQAYVGMADTYNLLREYSIMPDTESYPRAIAAAKKAVELDDSLSEAHRALAFAETYGNWDFINGEKDFRRAIELNPQDPTARLWYANAFAFPDRFGDSLEEIEKARELDPGSHAIIADKGLLLYYAGRNQDAIKILQEVESSNPGFRSPHSYLMSITLALGDYPGYLSEGEKTAQAQDDPVQKEIIAAARAGYERDGGKGLLQNLYETQKKYYLEGKFPGTLLALTCMPMGKTDEALQFIEGDYSQHRDWFLTALRDPVLRRLADQSRYKALKSKISLPPPPQTKFALTRFASNPFSLQ